MPVFPVPLPSIPSTPSIPSLINADMSAHGSEEEFHFEERREGEGDTTFGDRVLAPFEQELEEDFQSRRQHVARTPVMHSTPAAGRSGPGEPSDFDLPTGLSIARDGRAGETFLSAAEHQTPIRQQGRGAVDAEPNITVEQAFGDAGMETLTRLMMEVEQLKGNVLNREEEQRRLLEELMELKERQQAQDQLQDELEFEKEQELLRQQQREDDIRARRATARARDKERLLRLKKEEEAELKELEEQRALQQEILAARSRRQHLTLMLTEADAAPQVRIPPVSTSPIPQVFAAPVASPVASAVPSVTAPHAREQISLLLPTANPFKVPVTSTIEEAYRRAEPAAGGMSDEQFGKALKALEKSMAHSKGHVFKGTSDVQKYEDWILALDELLLEANLLSDERFTDAQRLRLITLLGRTCLDRDDKLVNDRWRVVKDSVTTVKEFKRAFGERFLGRDPMKGLWERWDKCTQSGRRFDNYYHELITLARQLQGISPELIFRKLKSGTDAEVRFKDHDKAAIVGEGDYRALATIYSLADEAIRDLAREKKDTRDHSKDTTERRSAGGKQNQSQNGLTRGSSATWRQPTTVTTTVTEKLGGGKGNPSTATGTRRETQQATRGTAQPLSAFIPPSEWAKLSTEEKQKVLAQRQAARVARKASVKAVTVAGQESGNRAEETGAPNTEGSGQPRSALAKQPRATAKAVRIGEKGDMVRDSDRFAPGVSNKGGKGRERGEEQLAPGVSDEDVKAGIVDAGGHLKARGPVLAAWIHIAGHKARVQLDSGTTNTLLNDRFVALHNLPKKLLRKPAKVGLAMRGSKGTIAAYTIVGTTINGEFMGQSTMEIAAVDGWDAIIGSDVLHQWGAMLNYQAMEASYRSPKHGRMLFELANTEETVRTLAAVNFTPPAEIDPDRTIIIKRVFDPTGIKEYDEVCEIISNWPGEEDEETRVALRQLVYNYGVSRGVFREDKKLPAGWLPPLRYLDDGTELNHRWEYIDPNKKPHTRPLRYPARYEAQIVEKCRNYVEAGVWVPIVTDDVIPTFCVPKKDPSKARLVFDERQRNANRVPDKTPLPNMDNIVMKAHEATHMSQFDIIVAYEELRNARDMEKYTGFSTPWGVFGSRVGTMGDKNMPGSFQRNMNIVAGHHLAINIHPYLDNHIITTKGTLKEHYLVVVWLIERLREGEWFIGDVELDADEMEVLGYTVGKGSKKPGPRVLNPILEAPPPRSIAQVDRMLGAYNFCSQHGTARQAVAKTYLSAATRFRAPARGKPDRRSFPPYTVNGKFVWTPACQEAWEQLKQDMAKCLRLKAFQPDNPELRTYLITDASLVGMAGYVAQGPANGTWEDSWPIEVWARAFTPAETNYSTTVQEKLAVVQALTHFEHLLRGVQFTLCTDHKALIGQGTTGKPSTDRKLARWQTYMDTFAMDYAHIPGDGNLLADTLSRVWENYTHDEIPAVKSSDSDAWRWNMARVNSISFPGEGDSTAAAAEPEILLAPSIFEELRGEAVIAGEILDTVFGVGCREALSKAQAEDKLYALAYVNPTSYKNFKATKGEDNLLRFNGRIVVSLAFEWHGRSFTRTLIEYVHLEKAHVGARDTLAGLRGWFWEYQAREVKEFVKECDACQRAKHRSTLPAGQHVAMPTTVSGFRHIAWDFQGPLPESKDADGSIKTGLWNVLARGTGYIIMVPIRHDASAEDLAKIFVERIYPTTGIPETVLSDRDTRFTSAFWAAVVALLPMKDLMTTAFHPRTNGGIEGRHRIVNMAMTSLVETRQQNWVQCVPHVQFRMNCTKSSTTGYTPFELTMGYVPSVFPTIADMPVDTPEAAKAYLGATADARLAAEDAIIAARLRQTNYENATRGATPIYNVGDRVLLSTENLNLKARGEAGQAKKWQHRWVGPFTVKEQKGTTVELDLPATWAELYPKFHVQLIRPYHGAAGRYDEPPPELDTEGVHVYEVEDIINHRWNARKQQYEWRVKWKGYAEQTWEPLENLAGAGELLREYREKHGDERRF